MRDVVLEILHGLSGQTLYLDVPEGRPSSVTDVKVVENENDDDGPAESATSGPGTVETSPNAASTAASGFDQADPTVVALDAVTGISGDGSRAFLFTAPNGDHEMVRPIGVSGLNVRLSMPLLNAYAVGSTFKSTRITVNVDTTWVGDKANLADEEDTFQRYRAIWTYVVNGQNKRRAVLFDLVRYSAVHHVTPLDVDAAFPGWISRLPTDYRREQGRPLIDEAWRGVRVDLLADRKLGRWIRDLDVVTELVCARSNLAEVEHMVMQGGVDPLTAQRMLDSAQKIYRQRYDQLIREPHTQAAAQPMGGRVEARRAPFWSR